MNEKDVKEISVLILTNEGFVWACGIDESVSEGASVGSCSCDACEAYGPSSDPNH